MDGPAGYLEIEHTADWELEVWAADLPGLFVQAARGMYALTGAQLQDGPRQVRTLVLESGDAESLLVRFLAELLYFAEAENLGFDIFNLQAEQSRLQARLGGAPLAEMSKEIKAVTYHNLAIRQTGQGLAVNIIFDV